MGELLLAHGGEIHGFPPFAFLFLAVLVMGLGLAIALKRPPDADDSEASDSPKEEGERSPRTPQL
jgi:type III secretory pathway component EscV